MLWNLAGSKVLIEAGNTIMATLSRPLLAQALTALSKNYLSIMMKTETAATNECQLLQHKAAQLTLGSPQTLPQNSYC